MADIILLGLGTNLGDRQQNLETALESLQRDAGLKLLAVSSIYESAALLPENAPTEWDIPYFNLVVSGKTALSPEALLNRTQHIQQAMGRQDIGRWGPRLIDIDLLAHGQVIMETERLTLPHPEMLSRDFVMLPLAEIAPGWRHPVSGETPEEWAAHHTNDANIIKTDVKLNG